MFDSQRLSIIIYPRKDNAITFIVAIERFPWYILSVKSGFIGTAKKLFEPYRLVFTKAFTTLMFSGSSFIAVLLVSANYSNDFLVNYILSINLIAGFGLISNALATSMSNEIVITKSLTSQVIKKFLWQSSTLVVFLIIAVFISEISLKILVDNQNEKHTLNTSLLVAITLSIFVVWVHTFTTKFLIAMSELTLNQIAFGVSNVFYLPFMVYTIVNGYNISVIVLTSSMPFLFGIIGNYAIFLLKVKKSPHKATEYNTESVKKLSSRSYTQLFLLNTILLVGLNFWPRWKITEAPIDSIELKYILIHLNVIAVWQSVFSLYGLNLWNKNLVEDKFGLGRSDLNLFNKFVPFALLNSLIFLPVYFVTNRVFNLPMSMSWFFLNTLIIFLIVLFRLMHIFASNALLDNGGLSKLNSLFAFELALVFIFMSIQIDTFSSTKLLVTLLIIDMITFLASLSWAVKGRKSVSHV